ncbi:MAG: hypothetical protein GY814_17710 [Gammaproteobacteria bacterium]|nr:hypothetical protein [Gammaproteobacteria bacterium]
MIAQFIPLIGTVLDKIFPDPEAASAAKLKLLELQQSGELETLKQAGSIITAEAKSDHWIVAAWRPITMLVFVTIIANNYILAPYIDMFFETNIVLDLPPQMWDLLKIGLGGYIVGRTGEKMIKTHKDK